MVLVAGPTRTATKAEIIRLRGIALTYPATPPVRALRPCDLTIHRGEHVALIGPSGSGKSTLLNVIGLLDRPTAGDYELDGVTVGGLRERDRTALRGRRIGFVFQSFHLLPYRTALENVSLAQLYSGVSRRTRENQAIDALAQVGMAHRIHAYPTTLSGGERQRVAIARAVATQPALLLCDEPTGNLDSETAETILALLHELNSHGLTLLVVTHDHDVAARAGRVLHMLDGNLTEP